MKRPALIISALIGIGLVAAVVVVTIQSFVYTAKVSLDVAPTSASTTFNGKVVGPGTIATRPGTIIIVVSKPGFGTQTKTITAVKGQTVYAGIALASTDATTKNWYATHSADELLVEKITGKNDNATAKQTVDKFPLIAELPHIDNFYRVDYGPSVAHPNDLTATALFITYYSAAGKQQALDWIKFKGYDTSKLEIIYTDKTSQGFN